MLIEIKGGMLLWRDVLLVARCKACNEQFTDPYHADVCLECNWFFCWSGHHSCHRKHTEQHPCCYKKYPAPPGDGVALPRTSGMMNV